MLHHLSFGTVDLARATAFYDAVLSALGYARVWTGESDYMPIVSPRYFIPFNGESFYAVGWGRWYQRGGFYGNPKAEAAGCIPIPKDHPMFKAVEDYEKALRAPNFTEQLSQQFQL